MENIEIFHLSKKLMNAYNDACIPLCKQYGITQNALDILLFLGNNPQYNSAKEICEIRGLKSGIVSVMIEKLIRKGYLKREVNRKDRRMNRLYVTEHANEIIVSGQKIQKQFFDDVSSDITENEIKELQSVLLKLKHNLERMKL